MKVTFKFHRLPHLHRRFWSKKIKLTIPKQTSLSFLFPAFFFDFFACLLRSPLVVWIFNAIMSFWIIFILSLATAVSGSCCFRLFIEKTRCRFLDVLEMKKTWNYALTLSLSLFWCKKTVFFKMQLQKVLLFDRQNIIPKF